MKHRYVSLEEAHPPIQSFRSTALGVAMIRAYKKAIQRGKPVPPVPECARSIILASKTRHSFT